MTAQRFLLTALIVMGTISNPLYSDVKIGVVDSQRILSSYAAAVDASKQLETENSQWAQDLQKLTEELKRQEDEFDRQSLLLSEAKKEERIKELQVLRDKIQKFREDKWGDNGEYFQRQQQLMKPVFDRINEVINMLSEDDNYDLILDTINGNVLYVKAKYDITQYVLDELESDLPESD